MADVVESLVTFDGRKLATSDKDRKCRYLPEVTKLTSVLSALEGDLHTTLQ